MNPLSHTMVAFFVSAGLLAASTTAAAQGKPAQTSTPPPAAPAKYVPPIRGTADLGYLKPLTKRVKDEVITTIQVKNLSPAPIAGLKIAEYWWDKAGNPVTGSEDRLKRPLQSGEVVTMTLKTPYNAKMDRNNYVFAHANGSIKTKLLKTLK